MNENPIQFDESKLYKQQTIFFCQECKKYTLKSLFFLSEAFQFMIGEQCNIEKNYATV